MRTETQNIVVISVSTLMEAETLIEACEACSPRSADTPFDWIIDRVTLFDAKVTDYILEVPARCPACHQPIFEKTLVLELGQNCEPRLDN